MGFALCEGVDLSALPQPLLVWLPVVGAQPLGALMRWVWHVFHGPGRTWLGQLWLAVEIGAAMGIHLAARRAT